MAETTPRAFVCGHPIIHSRSPLIHNHWLKRYGLTGSYERVDVAPEDFAQFIARLAEQGFVGGNVTLPHKEAAAALVAHRDESATIIGAVNTLWFEDGLLCGSNTDAYGFSAYLDQVAPDWKRGRIATVLGAGGASRAIIHALQSNGYRDIRVVNRTLLRATELANRFVGGVTAHGWQAIPELLPDTDLLVNTSTLGMTGKDSADIDLSPLPDKAIVNDIVYVPLKTALLADAERRGLKTVDGLGMLLHQAVPGFERWFGRRPEVTAELHAEAVADLERAA
ncbi:shikimate dehydrogenase [Mesorhizobium sp. J18]|uniref:shikimate dehydrogenase n=1 Tax=Mesorhizobium sp. J18 TaxID=935263 RepID=UPI00119C31DC|nr:shikimate dehydrogenase [Mesorhizobium sp. J18]TWG88984.1 shikimate dehydrogenase [Mesorhizobium sp. J18]